jgi:predicted SAM-dependent methyltransferase
VVSEPSSMTPEEARDVLISYLKETTTRADKAATTRSTDPPLMKLGKRALSPSLRMNLRLILTDLLRWRERGRSARLSSPLRLHLGSGFERKPGWTNVDLFGYGDIALNLTRPLPVPSGSAESIFHEHLLEHLTLRQGVAVLSECYRILQPGGVLRIGVPDTGSYIRSYIQGGRGLIEMVRPGRPTPLIAMQEIFYWYGHRSMYDFETLAMTCRAVGFANEIEQRPFGDSRLRPAPDTDARRDETLYVETAK